MLLIIYIVFTFYDLLMWFMGRSWLLAQASRKSYFQTSKNPLWWVRSLRENNAPNLIVIQTVNGWICSSLNCQTSRLSGLREFVLNVKIMFWYQVFSNQVWVHKCILIVFNKVNKFKHILARFFQFITWVSFSNTENMYDVLYFFINYTYLLNCINRVFLSKVR